MGPSVQQLLIILLIVVLLFGAKKIPELAKGLGKGIKSFKSVFANKSIRKKIVATLLLVLVYKLLSVIPVY